MAIKSRRNFMTVFGAADLELEAKKGQSILVKNVMVYEPTAVYAIFKTGNTTVGTFRVASLLGNHLQIPHGKAYHSHDLETTDTAVIAIAGDAGRVQNAGGTETPLLLPVLAATTVYQRMMNNAQSASVGSETILQYLMRKGIFTGFPVASGETFLITDIDDATSMKIVEYDIYDEDDMKSEMENGSKADVLTYLSYGDYGADILLEVDPVLGESNNPPEYPDFPFGDKVPDNRIIEVHGILASDVSPALNVAANRTSTRYLKLMRGIEFLFDQDLNGIPYYSNFNEVLGNENMIAEGYAPGGNYTQCDRREPLIFDPPVVFDAGETLTVMWNTETNGTGIAISQALHEVAFILKMKPKS
ncbi:hypothetical protein ES705_37176 [subsurface metagenome]